MVSNLSELLSLAHFWWVTWVNCSPSLICGEQPKRLAHIAQFWWATWAICSHRSLRREWANHSFLKTYKKTYKKRTKKYDLIQIFWANCSFLWANRSFLWAKEWMCDCLQKMSNSLICSFMYHEPPERITQGCSFVMSDLSNLLTVALLSWALATWAHRCSFVLNDLSESLTVAHLISAIWANEQIPNPKTTFINFYALFI